MTKPIIYDGTPHEETERIAVQAGSFSLLFEAGTLRYIRVGAVEVIRQIYAAVRDQNWGTVPAALNMQTAQIHADSFQIAFEMTHADLFKWSGTITGRADSTITFDFDGVALRDFWRNRVGFCVLHPMEVGGKACSIEHVDGRITEGHFPETIQPHQPFFDIRSITHEAAPGVRVQLTMTGDTFEMEDQRNWTDASFKTYCTPLRLPFPAEVKAGERIHQTITLSLVSGMAFASHDGAAETPVITLLPYSVAVPAIGLGMATHTEPLTSGQIERLRQLQLAYLRVDLYLDQSTAQQRLTQAAETASAIGIPLEIAVFVTDNAEAELSALADWLDEQQPSIARFAVFHQTARTTPAPIAAAAQSILSRFGVPVGGGTDAFFTELNRERPPIDELDFVTYSLNPQVHAFDNASLVETLAAQGATVESSRAFSDDKPVHVGPVTLKMRWNPNATGPEPEPAPGQLPPQVDVRQSSLFGASWTLGSLKYLAESGANAVTYYETTGWRGVSATEAGSPLPDQFYDVPGGVYPLWYVLKQVGDFAPAGEIVRTTSSSPLQVEALVLRSTQKLCLLVGNFTADTQAVRLRNVPSGVAQLHLLTAENAAMALAEPDSFLQSPGVALDRNTHGTAGDLSLELPPFALAFLNWELAGSA